MQYHHVSSFHQRILPFILHSNCDAWGRYFNDCLEVKWNSCTLFSFLWQFGAPTFHFHREQFPDIIVLILLWKTFWCLLRLQLLRCFTKFEYETVVLNLLASHKWNRNCKWKMYFSEKKKTQMFCRDFRVGFTTSCISTSACSQYQHIKCHTSGTIFVCPNAVIYYNFCQKKLWNEGYYWVPLFLKLYEVKVCLRIICVPCLM